MGSPLPLVPVFYAYTPAQTHADHCQAQVDEVSCVWVGAAKDSRKDTEGWQTSAGVHRGLEVIAVHAYEFWDKDILCPIPVSVHLKGS